MKPVSDRTRSFVGNAVFFTGMCVIVPLVLLAAVLLGIAEIIAWLISGCLSLIEGDSSYV